MIQRYATNRKGKIEIIRLNHNSTFRGILFYRISGLYSLNVLIPGILKYIIRSNRREVTDKEMNNLSKKIPDGKYIELFVTLGFEYNKIDKIKKSRHNDVTSASEVLFHEWRDKGGFMDDLDAALDKAGLKGLVPQYKN